MPKIHWSKLAFIVLTVSVCGISLAADHDVQVVAPRSLGHWWLFDPAHPEVPPKYPAAAIGEGVQGCFAVAYEIGSDGRVSHARIWRSAVPNVWARQEMEQAALAAIHQARFIPAPANQARDPVYTYLIDTFTLRNRMWSMTRSRIEGRKYRVKCKMPDFVQQVRADAVIPDGPAGENP